MWDGASYAVCAQYYLGMYVCTLRQARQGQARPRVFQRVHLLCWERSKEQCVFGRDVTSDVLQTDRHTHTYTHTLDNADTVLNDCTG